MQFYKQNVNYPQRQRDAVYIKHRRQQLGWNITETAHALGVSPIDIINAENPHNVMEQKALHQIKRKLRQQVH